MYFPGAFDPASRIKIETHYPAEKRICVSEPDALRFACNTINVGRTLLINETSNELRDRLIAAGYEVVQVQLGEFLKAGGAAKCLVLRLARWKSRRNGVAKWICGERVMFSRVDELPIGPQPNEG